MEDTAAKQTPNTEPFFARLKAKLKSYKLIYYPAHYILWPIKRFKPFMRWQIYKHTVKFNPNGLNRTEHRPRKIIVSLTSYPARMKFVPYVIASLLNQTMKPDKIILWLAEPQFPDKKLPRIFKKLQACGVEVKFCPENLGPHTKYFYALQEYPEDLILTFDDDIIYRDFIIETLYKSYLEHPDCVSAMRVTVMNLMPDGSFSFPLWYREPDNSKGQESHSFFATGVAGALYPPHSFSDEVFNVKAMMKLCPRADDTWLKIMEVMHGVKVASAFTPNATQGWEIIGSQKFALWKKNVIDRADVAQLNAAFEAYSDWRDPEGRTLFEVIREG